MSLTSYASTGQYMFIPIPIPIDYNLNFETECGLANNSRMTIQKYVNPTNFEAIPMWTCIGDTNMYLYKTKEVQAYITYSGKQVFVFYGTDFLRTIVHDGVMLPIGTYVVDYYVGCQGNSAGGTGVILEYSTNGSTTFTLISTVTDPYRGGDGVVTDISSSNCLVTSSSFTLTTSTLVQIRLRTIVVTPTVTAYTVVDNFSFRKI